MNQIRHTPQSVIHTALFALSVTSVLLASPAYSASLTLATSPLATSTTSTVKPNLLFIIDNSGSMGWEFMPDSVDNNDYKNCYRNHLYNGVYYNPDLTYTLPINSDGSSYPASSFTAAKTNGFGGTTTTNLSSAFRAGDDGSDQAAYYYKYTGTTPAVAVRGTCYADTSYTKVTVSSTSGPGSTDERTNFANWYTYYRTRLQTMKTAAGLAFSELNNSYRVGLMKISATTPVVYLNTFEGTHRDDWYTALYGIATSGSTPLRRSLADAGRYYAGELSGTDPVQYSCQQNFTILSTDGFWNGDPGFQVDGSTAVGNQDGTAGRPMFDGAQAGTTVTTTYTRNTFSETGTKISNTTPAGQDCNNNYRRIVVTPETKSCSITTVSGVAGAETCTSAVSGSKYYMSPYTYDKTTCVYKNDVSAPSSTSWVGASPVTTAGTGGGSSDSLADVAMYYYQTDLRTTDLGNCTGAISGEDVCENNVFIGANDNNTQQHMTTFTLGMGASGQMTYSASYLSDSSPTSAYVAVKLGSESDGSTICPWQTSGTTCNWPIPASDSLKNIDDLWHAAVNGRGAYFSAEDPTSLSAGLAQALAGINARKGAAAAAATSTLNPVAGNNFAYVASYTTVAWKGNLESRGINTDTGVVSENATWCVQDVVASTCASPGTIVAEVSGDTTVYNCVTPDSVICTDGVLEGTDCKIQMATACTGTMNALVADNSDTRTIKTANSTGSGLIDFSFANITATQRSYFAAAHIGTLSQWSTMTATQQAAAAGANLVNFMRGQFGYEDRASNAVDDRLYRYREAVLGDALESQPSYMGPPIFSYTYPGYSGFKTAQASRPGTVYMGANDGMLHAFAADTGIERWAYVPSMVMSNMWKLADTNYATLHTNYVNGSPITSDVCTANCADAATAVWKTIMVAGLNEGGRGYYAMDITDPTAPSLLWEFTTMSGLGAQSGYDDDDVGYSFGHPIITRKSDGTWVVLVTSGYNNTSPGDGKGYLYVLNAGTGAIISKISTGVGDTTTPSGLAHMVAWNDDPAGSQAGFVYGGDLQGNLWRFDIHSNSKITFATLFSDAAGTTPQPITTTPVLGKIAGKRVVFVGTGKYLETTDLLTTQKQSIYAIKDDDATTTLVNPRNTLVNQTLSNNTDGTATRVASDNAVNFYSGRGWYVDLPDSGERVNIDFDLVQGTLLVPTIVPSNTVCSPGGYGWLNYLDYKTGGAIDVSTGLSSIKYDSTIVGINIVYIGGKAKASVVTSTDPTPDLVDAELVGPDDAVFKSKRVIWRELIP